MYNNYINYLQNNNMKPLETLNFKNNNSYNSILEHVSYELGESYLNLVKIEFPHISYEIIMEFININDRIGQPNRYNYKYTDSLENSKYILSSPTSLRYIYHALIILEHYKKTECQNIVELGCGYGGLCLAIHYFAKINNIFVKNYNIIDLPDVCKLIKEYLYINNIYIPTPGVKLHESSTYGKDINDEKLFFISNYCYTEIEIPHNNGYSSILLPKTNHGFITWQNNGQNGAYPVHNASKITGKEIMFIIEEKPQTDTSYKNYYVYF
jgi:hypothetical protein